MAKPASAATVQADMRPANYRAAVKLLRSIDVKKDKIAGVMGEIADIHAKVEGHKVNKKGAKMFLTLDALDEVDRADVMRSLNGLMDASGWDKIAADLVDAAEDNVVPMRLGQKSTEPTDEEIANEDEAIAEEFDEASEEEIAQQETRQGLSKPSFGTGKIDTPKAGKAAADPEPYTGDNSDLAGDAE